MKGQQFAIYNRQVADVFRVSFDLRGETKRGDKRSFTGNPKPMNAVACG
jgi:hypothetical protein